MGINNYMKDISPTDQRIGPKAFDEWQQSVFDALNRSRSNQEGNVRSRAIVQSQEVANQKVSTAEIAVEKKAVMREQVRLRLLASIRSSINDLNRSLLTYAEDFGADVMVEVEDGCVVIYTKTKIA